MMGRCIFKCWFHCYSGTMMLTGQEWMPQKGCWSHPVPLPPPMPCRTMQGNSRVSGGEADVFLAFPCFFYNLTNVGNLISGSLAFSKCSLYIWKFSVHVLLTPSLKDLRITLLACEMSTIVQYFEHSWALPSFGIRMKTDLFQSCSQR